MKEADFRTSVFDHLPKVVHRQPIPADAYGQGGTPDSYLDFQRDLWVEWKMVGGEDRLPAFLKDKMLPTALQQRWLNRRYTVGKNALVVVGFKLRGRAHGVLLTTPEEWCNPVPRETYEPRLQPAKAIAAYLLERVS